MRASVERPVVGHAVDNPAARVTDHPTALANETCSLIPVAAHT